MRPNQYYQDKAIKQAIGQASPGDIVAHRSHELAHTLIDMTGLCKLPSGETNVFPISELFDVNRVDRLAFTMKIMDALIVERNN